MTVCDSFLKCELKSDMRTRAKTHEVQVNHAVKLRTCGLTLAATPLERLTGIWQGAEHILRIVISGFHQQPLAAVIFDEWVADAQGEMAFLPTAGPEGSWHRCDRRGRRRPRVRRALELERLQVVVDEACAWIRQGACVPRAGGLARDRKGVRAAEGDVRVAVGAVGPDDVDAVGDVGDLGVADDVGRRPGCRCAGVRRARVSARVSTAGSGFVGVGVPDGGAAFSPSVVGATVISAPARPATWAPPSPRSVGAASTGGSYVPGRAAGGRRRGRGREKKKEGRDSPSASHRRHRASSEGAQMRRAARKSSARTPSAGRHGRIVLLERAERDGDVEAASGTSFLFIRRHAYAGRALRRCGPGLLGPGAPGQSAAPGGVLLVAPALHLEVPRTTLAETQATVARLVEEVEDRAKGLQS
ncbi:hypothetical protein C8J57DRAFT_1221268 [Mycena rebaudengoi]|nr:hypothetical protein C8J57DRAFT_1221268 [Mycena rebaudengoi]